MGIEANEPELKPTPVQVEQVTFLTDTTSHLRIGSYPPYELFPKDPDVPSLAAHYDTAVKGWLARPGREVYSLTWDEAAGAFPSGVRLGEGERQVVIAGTRDEYLLEDPENPASVIGRYQAIEWPKVEGKTRMLVYRPALDEPFYHPEDDPANPYELYEAARQVQALVLGEGETSHDGPDDGVNSSFNQTATGLMLAFESGAPKSLWTPMGEVLIGRQMQYRKGRDDLVAALQQKGLRLKEFEPATQTEGKMGGVFGPIYAIEGVGDMQLPEPSRKTPDNYFPSKAARNTWNKYSEQYNASHKL